MRALFAAVWCRVCLSLVVLCAGALLPLEAGAQSAPALWTGATCNGCHGEPPTLAANIPFGDATLFATLSAFKARVGKATSNATMRTFAGTEPGSANTFTDAQRQSILDYLINVRDAVVTPSVGAFPATDVNQTSATTRAITIVNYRGEDLNFTPSLSNSADFSMTNNCDPGPKVLAQTSCSITVSFRPTQGVSTTRSSDLTIDFTSGSISLTTLVPPDRTIALSGTVNPPLFAFASATANFSSRLNQALDVNVGRVTNTGNATLSLSNIALQGAAPVGATYQLITPVGACTTTQQLAKNGSCDLWIRFTPSAQGTTNATFRISHNAAGSPVDLALQGTGTQPLISATSASLAFDNVQFGVPKSLPLTISNVGNMPLTFNADPTAAAARTGPNKDDFAVTGCSAGAPLSAGSSCTLTVTFTPQALGARTATLTVASDANNGSLLTVPLGGTGVALPEPVVTYPTTDFPDTVIGETAAQTRLVTITNDRTRNITYSVTGTTDFKVGTESCPGRVVPGGGVTTCTITLEFRPALGGGEGRRQVSLPITFAGTSTDAAPSPVTGTVAGNALLPILLSAPTLNPAAVVGSPTTSSLLLTNRSAAAVTLSSLAFSGTTAADYSIDAGSGCTNGASVAAGGNCTLVIRFAPAAAGPRDATLTITHSALGSPQTVALQGAATPAPQGRIELSAFSLAFADTQLGSSSAQSVTVRNAGNLALAFSAFDLAGAAAGDYERTGSCSTATPIAIGAECTLTITFRPAALGARSASLTIQSDASNGAATIAITGTGVPVPAPQVSLVPASLDFGTQTVGGVYPARTVRLSNSGTADLNTSALVVEGATFATATVCPATLAPGAGCDVQILFAPAAADTDFTGTLRVTSNAGGSPHTAALRGRGSATAQAVLVWSPAVTQLAFGNVSAGSISAVQSATLLNQGPGGVNLTVLNALGTGATAFSVGGGTCQVGQPLFEGATCRVDVRFAPSIAGDRTATVQIASTGSFPPALSLTGTGLGGPTPGAALSVTALSFENTRVGDRSLPGEVTISSTGSGVVRVTALDISGPYTVQGKTCPSLPFALPAGGECVVTVMFLPQAEGSAAGMLRVTTSANPAIQEVALSGQGDPKADLSSGGCSMASGDTATDPTLWALVLLAAAVLVYRRRAQRRAGPQRRAPT